MVTTNSISQGSSIHFGCFVFIETIIARVLTSNSRLKQTLILDAWRRYRIITIGKVTRKRIVNLHNIIVS